MRHGTRRHCAHSCFFNPESAGDYNEERGLRFCNPRREGMRGRSPPTAGRAVLNWRCRRPPGPVSWRSPRTAGSAVLNGSGSLV